MDTNFIVGKTAIITGVSRGLGKELTHQLLDLGATVIGWGRTQPDYQHPQFFFIHCQVQNPESVQQAWEKSQAISSNIHFLINNGGFGAFAPIEKIDPSIWQEMFDVNVKGAFLCSQAVVPQMKAQQSGHILNISSIAGRVGMPQGEAYNASKFALRGFSESLFQELRKDRIKVSTIYPGSIATHFFDEIAGVDAHENMMDAATVAKSIIQIMDTPPNYLVREIEMRPLVSKPPK